VTAAVMGDAAVAFGGEEEHLVFPIVGIEGPGVAEEDGFAGGATPVFVEDEGFVFTGDERHFDE
jgi:hypothetical protein